MSDFEKIRTDRLVLTILDARFRDAFLAYRSLPEAVVGVLNHLFLSRGLHRVTASIDPENTRSAKLLMRVDLRQEADFRQSLRTAAGWSDDCVYAARGDEWLREHPNRHRRPDLRHSPAR